MLKALLITLIMSFAVLLFPQDSHAYYTGQPADLVIGQPDFTSINGEFTNDCPLVNQYTLCGPQGILIVNGKLIVADRGNRRVIIYNSLPTSSHPAADVVLGKPNFTTDNSIGTASMSFFNSAWDVASDGTRLFIADAYDCHVLVYNTIPTVSGAPADYIVGQPDISSCDPDGDPDFHPTQATIRGPMGLSYDSSTGKFFIFDGDYDRITIYNSIPLNSSAQPNVVIGQSTFTAQDGDGLPHANRFGGIGPAKVLGGKLIHADWFFGRVMVWNSIPTTNDQSANVAIGKSSLTSTSYSGPEAYTTNEGVSGIDYDGSHLFVSDSDNNRVMLFNGIPTSNNASAEVFLGQDGSNTKVGCGSVASEYKLCEPTVGIAHSGGYLYVADTGFNRILRFPDVSDPSPPSQENSAVTLCPNTFTYCIDSGPSTSDGMAIISGIGTPDASQSKTMISDNASPNDLHVTITSHDPADLITQSIPFPWQQGLNSAGNVFDFQAVAAFNGYPIPQFDNPVIIIIPYEPIKLNGVDPSKLRIAYYDTETKRWVKMNNNTVLNTTNHTLANTTTKFSQFTVVYPR